MTNPTWIYKVAHSIGMICTFYAVASFHDHYLSKVKKQKTVGGPFPLFARMCLHMAGGSWQTIFPNLEEVSTDKRGQFTLWFNWLSLNLCECVCVRPSVRSCVLACIVHVCVRGHVAVCVCVAVWVHGCVYLRISVYLCVCMSVLHCGISFLDCVISTTIGSWPDI